MLTDIPYYTELLKSGGKLILSGFHQEDIDELKNKAKDFNFNYSTNKGEWVSMNLTKI